MLVRGILTVTMLGLVGWLGWTLAPSERVLLSGQFHSVAHKGSGYASISAGHLRLSKVKTYPANDWRFV